MKTPKRDYFVFAELDMYTTPGTSNKLSARWKRKNRVKQLKHTIARLNRELALFLADGRYELIIDALQTLAEHGDADIKRACINALADFAK